MDISLVKNSCASCTITLLKVLAGIVAVIALVTGFSVFLTYALTHAVIPLWHGYSAWALSDGGNTGVCICGGAILGGIWSTCVAVKLSKARETAGKVLFFGIAVMCAVLLVMTVAPVWGPPDPSQPAGISIMSAISVILTLWAFAAVGGFFLTVAARSNDSD